MDLEAVADETVIIGNIVYDYTLHFNIMEGIL